ncbi:hypothetical protein OXX79_005541 [Metschnikowia pulcherrima]
MRHFSAFLSLALSVPFMAGTGVATVPFNVKIYDSHVPQRLANRLVAETGENPASKSYERLYIGSQNGPNGTVGKDEYICEIHSETELSKRQKDTETKLPEWENQKDILANAMAIVHDTFPAEACLYAYDLRGMYWTYALCSGDKIIQYHEGAKPEERPFKHVSQMPNTVFVLGRFSRASDREVLFHNQASKTQYETYMKHAERTVTLLDEKSAPYTHLSAQKAVSQIVTDGSVCDMTLQPRTIEVVYKCDAAGGHKAAILDVLEIKTCHYRMFVHVPKLCSYAPFSPHGPGSNPAVDVACQRVSSEENAAEIGEFGDYLSNVAFRDHPLFPIRADNRIDVSRHVLGSLGRGFYIAKSKDPLKTSNEYYNSRNVAIFTGTYSSLTDLNAQFGRAFYKAMGSTLLAPSSPEQGVKILQWSHSFVIWYEIYDHTGTLLGVTRIEHDAFKKRNALEASLLDPVTLLDVEGDEPRMVAFQRPFFAAPHGFWNFEAFSVNGEPLKGVAHDPTENRIKRAESRSIMAFNRGILGDSRVNMQLVDQTSGETLSGHYDESGVYVFEIEPWKGHRHSFAVEPLRPEQDFVGFTITIDVPDNVEVRGAYEDARNEKIDQNFGDDLQTGQKEVETGDESSAGDLQTQPRDVNVAAHDEVTSGKRHIDTHDNTGKSVETESTEITKEAPDHVNAHEGAHLSGDRHLIDEL